MKVVTEASLAKGFCLAPWLELEVSAVFPVVVSVCDGLFYKESRFMVLPETVLLSGILLCFPEQERKGWGFC